MATYRKSKETQERIIEATKYLVLKDGYKNTNIKSIAEYLRIPRSLIYYYFKNKDSIMKYIFNCYYDEITADVKKALPDGSKPLVGLMLRYVIFFRTTAWNPILVEYLIARPAFSTLGKENAYQFIKKYYAESTQLFEQCGMPTDDNKFMVHILMAEVVWKSLVEAVYYKTIELNERELLEYYSERTLMVTFKLSEEKIEKSLDEAIRLADTLHIPRR